MVRNYSIKTIGKLLIIMMLLVLFTACKKDEAKINNAKIMIDYSFQTGISEDEKFKSVVVDITIEDFNNSGFAFGDSCNVKFSNGYELNDIPYYNGYYVKNGDPLIVGYPASVYIGITLNNTGIWEQANLTEDVTVDITLNETKKYLATQEALGQSYSLDRSQYNSDAEFCNFRELSGGSLKAKTLYRGASPVDNSRNRVKYTNRLLSSSDISYVIDLADSSEDMESYIESGELENQYITRIYKDNGIIFLSMGSSYGSEQYKKSVANGLRFIINNHNGKTYIHCMEGKDRTGFVCMLIEALCGATYEEMCNDYMITYENYYKITKDKTPEKYNAIVELYFNSFVEYLHGTSDIEVLKKADYTEDAKKYLIDGGMSEEEVSTLITKLTE